MDSLDRSIPKKASIKTSSTMKRRQELYAKAKSFGISIVWRKASIKILEESLAEYTSKKMDKIYRFISTNQLRRIDARNLRAIQSLPPRETLNMTIRDFNRIIHTLPAGEDRSMLLHIKDEQGDIVKSITLRGNQLGARIFISIAEGTVSDADVDITDVSSGSVDVEWILKESNQQKRSEFFRYLTKEYYGLEDFQVYNHIDPKNKESQIPCFLFALQMADVPKETINSIASTMFSYAATHDFIRRTALKYNLHIALHTLKANETEIKFNKSSFGDKSLPAIELGCVAQHIFAIKQTNISRAAILHPEFASYPTFPSIRLHNGKVARGGSPKLLMSHQVIANLYINRETLLTPITLENAPCLLNNKFGEIDSLSDDAIASKWFKPIGLTREEVAGEIYKCGEKFGSPPFKIKVADSYVADEFEVVYFDLETFSDSSEHLHARFPDIIHKGYDHIPYCAAWKVGNRATQVSFGIDCVRIMLEALPPNGNFLLIAHNLGFDIRFLIKHLTTFDKKMGVIDSGSHMKQLIGSYKGRHLVFKDSMAFIAGPLAGLPAMFPGACDEITLEKESFPHDRMNTDTFDSKIKVDDETLIANASRIGAFEDGVLDVKPYSMHYCKRDVDVLAACFNRFRTMFMDRFKQDVFHHISMPGLAYAIFNNSGAYDGCYSLSGPALSFVRKAIVGGRVMTRDNEKHHTTHEVVDFDAVSLYPSAMARLKGFARGKPLIHRGRVPHGCDFHISKVRITSLSKSLHFPLQSIKIDGESRNFTNDLVGRELIMDQYALEDLVEFQGATYEVIEGLYWNSGLNPQIRLTAQDMFNERLKLKKQKNPLQAGLKLCLNSSYGKLVQKPIVKQKTIIRGVKAIESYTVKRINRLIQRTPVSDDIAIFEEYKPLSDHFSPAHLGVQILSMSKRIMSEVMTLAEDKDLKIWYQDTDSMHIDRASLSELTESFSSKYNRELVGEGLGQFHSDFELDGAKGEVFATESYFISKKTYVDFLACDGNDATGVHKRMKGIPSKLITDPRSTYEALFNGKSQSFDLTLACPIQINSRTQRVMKRNEFIRKVSA